VTRENADDTMIIYPKYRTYEEKRVIYSYVRQYTTLYKKR
jgi:hypothetical protein